MEDLNDLKGLWLKANISSLPDSKEMARAIKKFRAEKLFKICYFILIAFALVISMILLILTGDEIFLSTRIGGILIILAGLLFIATNLNSLYRFYNLKECSNKDFLIFLEKTKIRQLFYYNRTQIVGLCLMFCGLLIYLYEFVSTNTILFIISYLFVLLYLLLVVKVLRPKAFKINSKKLQLQIEHLQSMNNQL